MKHQQNTGISAFRMVAGAVSAAVLLSACVSNQPQGVNAGQAGSAQMAGGLAQALLGGGQGNTAVATQMLAGAGASTVNLPPKMSCKEITSRLVKTRTDMAALNRKPAAPVAADNKLAMAGGLASLAGSLTGNSQLAQMGDQMNAVGGTGAGDNSALANLDAVRAELEARGAAQKCKLPSAPVANMATPVASTLSCGQIKQELKAVSAPAAPGKGLADQAQTLGMLASVAGSLTGNQTLKTVGDQANSVAGSGAPSADVASRRAMLEAQAKAQRCKL